MGKLLFCPLLTFGHFNCCINLGKYLLDKYPDAHEVYFLVNELWADKLRKWAPEFKTLVYKESQELLDEICNKIEGKAASPDAVNGTNCTADRVHQNGLKSEPQTTAAEKVKPQVESPSQVSKHAKEDPLNKAIQEFGKTWKLSALGRLAELIKPFRRVIESNALIEEQVLELVNNLHPQLILFDSVCMVPYLLSQGYPWGQIMTMNPLFIDHPQLPPTMSGLPTEPTPENQAQWKMYRQQAAKELQPLRERQNHDLRLHNQRELEPGQFIFSSPFLNIYIYPREIDYFDGERISMPGGRWIRMDSSFPPEKEITHQRNEHTVHLCDEKRIAVLKERLNFINDEWASLPGKLVYFSLGSMASAYLELTTRLIQLLGQIPHRFIVSKGPLGDEFDLPANCVGSNFLDQNTVLRCVDMMITHGGNNTLTECFHYGKPQLVLPLFSDQTDNAQRMMETGFGGRLNAFECTAQDIQDQIELLTSNTAMIQRMRLMAERTRKDNGMDAAVDEIVRFLNQTVIGCENSTFNCTSNKAGSHGDGSFHTLIV